MKKYRPGDLVKVKDSPKIYTVVEKPEDSLDSVSIIWTITSDYKRPLWSSIQNVTWHYSFQDELEEIINEET